MATEIKKSKIPYILSAVFLLATGSLIAYVVLRANDSNFPVTKYLITVGTILVGIVAIVSMIYWLLNRATTPKSDDSSSVKQLVGVDRALEIWREQFMRDNQIPYRIPQWDDTKKLVPCREDAIEFRDIMQFTDPMLQTSDKFLAFEAIVRDGRNTGMLVAVINIDLGEKYIRENWNGRVRWNKSMNTYNLQTKRMPLTSSKSYQERLGIKSVELAEEGYTQAEIDQIVKPFVDSQRAAAPAPQQTERKKPIRSANVGDSFPQFKDDDDDVEVEDIQEDIEAYRRRGS